MEQQDQEQPVQRLAKQTWPRPVPATHEWTKGVPAQDGMHNRRKDECKKCGCFRFVIIRVGQHDWIDHYQQTSGHTSSKAPICNSKTQ